MDEIEKALFALIKGGPGVKKNSSRRDPFGKVTVQGKKPSKAAVTKAIRSLSKEGRIRVVSNRFDTTYLPAARELRRDDDVRVVVDAHLTAVESTIKGLIHRVDSSTAKSLKDLDDALAEFTRAAKGSLKQREDWD